MKKLTVLVSPSVEARIEEIVRTYPFSSRHSVTRLAISVGISELEKSADRLLQALREVEQ